ncbi:hypothetical protein BDZ97DRAFT_1759312 [Flammula alnicola]|nr:hypothetical protein BDZ97DRAFT_1759312 [Flammula alnicola]
MVMAEGAPTVTLALLKWGFGDGVEIEDAVILNTIVRTRELVGMELSYHLLTEVFLGQLTRGTIRRIGCTSGQMIQWKYVIIRQDCGRRLGFDFVFLFLGKKTSRGNVHTVTDDLLSDGNLRASQIIKLPRRYRIPEDRRGSTNWQVRRADNRRRFLGVSGEAV